ncbi:MAG: hypothetical protein ACR2LS_00270 [Thermomicrobiales bacterium]
MEVARVVRKRRSPVTKAPSPTTRILPFAVGAAVGVTAGTVAGVLLEQEIGRAVGHVIGVIDRRSEKTDEPPFDLLLQ